MLAEVVRRIDRLAARTEPPLSEAECLLMEIADLIQASDSDCRDG